MKINKRSTTKSLKLETEANNSDYNFSPVSAFIWTIGILIVVSFGATEIYKLLH